MMTVIMMVMVISVVCDVSWWWCLVMAMSSEIWCWWSRSLMMVFDDNICYHIWWCLMIMVMFYDVWCLDLQQLWPKWPTWRRVRAVVSKIPEIILSYDDDDASFWWKCWQWWWLWWWWWWRWITKFSSVGFVAGERTSRSWSQHSSSTSTWLLSSPSSLPSFVYSAKLKWFEFEL